MVVIFDYPKLAIVFFVTDCIYMSADEGDFYHKASIADGSACGVYMFSEPDQKIEVQFNYLDVPCDNGGLVSVIFPCPNDRYFQ